MAIKNWSGWSVGLLWLAWLLPLLLLARANRQPPPAQWTGTANLSTDSLSDSQRVVLFFLLKERAATTGGDSVRLAALSALSSSHTDTPRDSIWGALRLPGHLSPEQQDSISLFFLRSLEPVGETIGRALGSPQLWWGLALQVGAFLVLPLLVLVTITLKWYVPRVVAKASRNAA